MCCVVKCLLPCGCSHRIVEGEFASSLQSGGICLPTKTLLLLVEILCEDKNNAGNDTGRICLSAENRFQISVKF
jgi:hypothetical protein